MDSSGDIPIADPRMEPYSVFSLMPVELMCAYEMLELILRLLSQLRLSLWSKTVIWVDSLRVKRS